MFVKVVLVLTVCILVNGFECPDYCTCTESFVTHTEDKIVRAKCTQSKGLNNFSDILSDINSIDLSAINLTEVSTNFNSFKVLSEVDLSHNELSRIPKLNNRITNLTLNHNQLTSSSISKLPLHVQYLNLAYNEISFVPKDMMRLNRLRKLELAGNPIDCNCDSIRVRNWLVKHFIASDLSVTCTTPKQFENQSWLEIDEFDVCEFEKIKNIEHFIESDHELMLADESNFNLDSAEGSGNDDSSTPSVGPILRKLSTGKAITETPPPGSGMPYLTMAKEVMTLLPKKKSEDGSTEVYATSGAAGVIIIALTVFAVYKKHQTGAANIETGEDGEELKTIGGLELAQATELVMSIDNQLKSQEPTNSEKIVKPPENIQDLQAAQALS